MTNGDERGMSTLFYAAAIHLEGETWGYYIPEFGGGGASTRDEATKLAREMLNTAIAELIETGQCLPAPSKIDQIDANGGHIITLPIAIQNRA